MCVCLCARAPVTRSRPRGPSKSGRPVNTESMKKAKSSQHKIRKGSRDRSTQVREPDKTNPRASPRTSENNPRGQRPTLQDDRKHRRTKKKYNTATARTQRQQKNENHHYLFRAPRSEVRLHGLRTGDLFPIDTSFPNR